MNAKRALQLLEKEMNRQEFLKLTGLLVVGIIGLPQLLSLLHGSTNPAIKSISKQGYGSSPYGR